VLPGATRLRIWADALQQLGISAENLRPVRAGIRKYSLPVRHFSTAEPVPLHAIYVLQTASSDRIEFSPITGLAKFAALTGATFRKVLIEPMDLAAPYFEKTVALAASARVTRVVRPRDTFTIDSLVDRLIEDFKR
jgi:hypothetical protein